jgi:uncharacterized protein YprB with RNaseH-like and TPR domain
MKMEKHSLRERLQAIKSLQAAVRQDDTAAASLSGSSGASGVPPEGMDAVSAAPMAGWLSVTGLVRKRTLTPETSVSVPALTKAVRQSLAVLVPDVLPAFHTEYTYEDFVFFDLETTGLSSGAGTVAFIAAFGRFKKARNREAAVQITQYLLLDYPGEYDFLEAILGEFDAPFIVTYNGKCFDAQILKTRCLMNAIVPPVFRHVDLLYPTRYLWKRRLASCSQVEIETAVLGLDRTGDISGAFAPDIWFSFLRTGEWEPLAGVCEHNKKDIFGLASIFTAFVRIAADPMRCAGPYGLDKEKLALRWRSALKYDRSAIEGRENIEETVRAAGDALMREASALGYPKAALVLAADCMKNRAFEEARRQLAAIASAAARGSARGSTAGSFPAEALALRGLAVDAERRLKDGERALSYVEQALTLEGIGSLRSDFEHRKERLLRNIEKAGADGTGSRR